MSEALGRRTLGRLTKVVLDTIKPLKGPTIVDIAKTVSSLDGIKIVNVKVNEVDMQTITMTIIIEGDNIDFDKVKEKLDELGVVIHSIDEAVGEP